MAAYRLDNSRADKLHMDRATVQRYLAEAEEHVRRGTVDVEKRREALGRLQRFGKDSSKARWALEAAENSLRRRKADRDRLLAALEHSFRRRFPGTSR